MTPPMWMVRASGRSARVSRFREDGVVALGVGREFGGIPEYEAADDLYEALRDAHPSWRPGRHRAAAAQLHCFLREMQPGDHVLTWDAHRRSFYLGTIDSEARWEPDATGELPYVRAVSWSHGLRPDELSPDCRSALNVIQTLFHVGRGIAQEVLAHARPIQQLDQAPEEPAPAAPVPPLPVRPDGPTERMVAAGGEAWVAPATDDAVYDVDVQHTPIPGSLKALSLPPAPAEGAPAEVEAEEDATPTPTPVVVVEEEADDAPISATPVAAPALPDLGLGDRSPQTGQPAGNLDAAARQRVEERLSGLGTDALRGVLAGVLQARGFPRRSVDPDSGADLFSGADLLGRAEAPLRVHVMDHGKEPVPAGPVEVVLDDRDPTERWILMAAEGFSRDARKAVDRYTAKGARCTLLDAEDLARLVLRHYDDLDLPTRALVPMVRVWWPAWEDKP